MITVFQEFQSNSNFYKKELIMSSFPPFMFIPNHNQLSQKICKISKEMNDHTIIHPFSILVHSYHSQTNNWRKSLHKSTIHNAELTLWTRELARSCKPVLWTGKFQERNILYRIINCDFWV